MTKDERIAELEAALRFYADRANWSANWASPDHYYRVVSEISEDRGARARALLEQRDR